MNINIIEAKFAYFSQPYSRKRGFSVKRVWMSYLWENQHSGWPSIWCMSDSDSSPSPGIIYVLHFTNIPAEAKQKVNESKLLKFPNTSYTCAKHRPRLFIVENCLGCYACKQKIIHRTISYYSDPL